MTLLMALVGVGSVACVAVTRSRAWMTEWTSAVLMAVGMIWICAGGPAILCAVVLITSGMVAGRGPRKVMSLHRGLTAIAMASIGLGCLTASQHGMTSMHRHELGPGAGYVSILTWALVVAAVGAGLITLIPRLHTAIEGSNSRRPPWAGSWVERSEAALMLLGLALMAVPM